MAMQHIPREQARAEAAAQSDEYGHGDPDGIRPGQQQPRQRTDHQTDEEQDDEVGEKTHARIVPLVDAAPLRAEQISGYPP